MTSPHFNVGAFVQGSPTSGRVLVQHSELLAAYADGVMHEEGDDREAYLSHFVFGLDLQSHYAANGRSVAGFAGPCWCRWLVLDIDAKNLDDALLCARKLVTRVYHRYTEWAGDVPVYFSGSKGFHVLVELAHNPPPAVGFNRVARAFAERLAADAEIVIDSSIYDLARVIRLPNTEHPKTGLFKRLIPSEMLFRMDAASILERAKLPAGDGIVYGRSTPTNRPPPANLEDDWRAAEADAKGRADARAEIRRDAVPDERAPRYVMEFLRFGVNEGERTKTLFRCAAWMTEQGAPPSLTCAILTDPGRDCGLAASEANRIIRCGIEHATRQKTEGAPAA